MDILQIKLMHKEAVGRVNDANILSKNIDRETDSNYLLELLAFELLLKAVALIHTGKYNENHNYQQLFESLPGPMREKILNRSFHWSQKRIEKRELQNLLVLYKNNFIKLRYPFEAYKNMNEGEYIEYGNLWVELGAPVDEAEFQYYPEELYGLSKALQEEVEEFLANKQRNTDSGADAPPPVR
jgi:hypothetical protein